MPTPFDLGLVDGNVWSAAHVNSIEAIINALKDVTNVDVIAALAARHAPLQRAWRNTPVVANQTGIVGAETDLTGMSVVVPTVAAHYYRVDVETEAFSSVAGDAAVIIIYQGVTQIRRRSVPFAVANLQVSASCRGYFLGAGGNVTVKVAMNRALGTGSISTFTASSTNPGSLLVEDLGT